MRSLVLCTDGFGGHGGIAKFNRGLLNALCSYPRCMEVVAIPRIVQSTIGTLPHKLDYVTDGLGGKFLYTYTVLRSIYKIKIDLIVCGHINLLPIAFMAHFLTKAPVILIVHGIDAWKPTRSRLSNYLVDKIDGLISVSDVTKIRLASWTNIKNVRKFILPNSIDFNAFSPGEKNKSLLERYGLNKRVVLLTLGRLSESEQYKGIDEVLDVLPELIKTIPNLSYLIVGDGSDKSRIEKKVELLGLNNYVIFAGFISEAEKVEHYRLADVFAMPGYGEGFGIVYLEAMACGIPVVASKDDGSREAVLDGKLGVLVNPHDPVDVENGILKALQNKKGVPEGLEYFSYLNFEQRVHMIVGELTKGGLS